MLPYYRYLLLTISWLMTANAAVGERYALIVAGSDTFQNRIDPQFKDEVILNSLVASGYGATTVLVTPYPEADQDVPADLRHRMGAGGVLHAPCDFEDLLDDLKLKAGDEVTISFYGKGANSAGAGASASGNMIISPLVSCKSVFMSQLEKDLTEHVPKDVTVRVLGNRIAGGGVHPLAELAPPNVCTFSGASGSRLGDQHYNRHFIEAQQGLFDLNNDNKTSYWEAHLSARLQGRESLESPTYSSIQFVDRHVPRGDQTSTNGVCGALESVLNPDRTFHQLLSTLNDSTRLDEIRRLRFDESGSLPQSFRSAKGALIKRLSTAEARNANALRRLAEDLSGHIESQSQKGLCALVNDYLSGHSESSLRDRAEESREVLVLRHELLRMNQIEEGFRKLSEFKKEQLRRIVDCEFR